MMAKKAVLIQEANTLALYLKEKREKVKFQTILEDTKDDINWGSSPTSRITTLMKYNTSISRCSKEGYYRYQPTTLPAHTVTIPKSLYEELENQAAEEGVTLEHFVTYLLTKKLK